MKLYLRTTAFKMTDSQGSIQATAGYTLSAEDGFITFTADQGGSSRFVTSWVHNPYKAAVDILTAWNSGLARQPDFATDNMRVWRSQKQKAIAEQIKTLKDMAGMVPHIQVVPMNRSDVVVKF
jgi:hypothetical protein